MSQRCRKPNRRNLSTPEVPDIEPLPKARKPNAPAVTGKKIDVVSWSVSMLQKCWIVRELQNKSLDDLSHDRKSIVERFTKGASGLPACHASWHCWARDLDNSAASTCTSCFFLLFWPCCNCVVR